MFYPFEMSKKILYVGGIALWIIYPKPVDNWIKLWKKAQDRLTLFYVLSHPSNYFFNEIERMKRSVSIKKAIIILNQKIFEKNNNL